SVCGEGTAMEVPERVRLLCTVRGCEGELRREEAMLVCPRRHAFNLARSGYVNLLQVQDRRSRSPGDSKEAVLARRRLLDAGFGRPLLEPLLELAGKLAPPGGSAALDVGCGEGTFLAALAERFRLEGFGVDISIPAIEA